MTNHQSSMINGQWSMSSMINGQWSIINPQWSMANDPPQSINEQWSMINAQWSIINNHWSMNNHQSSMINDLSSISNGQWSIMNGQWSTIGLFVVARGARLPSTETFDLKYRIARGAAGVSTRRAWILYAGNLLPLNCLFVRKPNVWPVRLRDAAIVAKQPGGVPT